jgi:hypothetical protein
MPRLKSGRFCHDQDPASGVAAPSEIFSLLSARKIPAAAESIPAFGENKSLRFVEENSRR